MRTDTGPAFLFFGGVYLSRQSGAGFSRLSIVLLIRPTPCRPGDNRPVCEPHGSGIRWQAADDPAPADGLGALLLFLHGVDLLSLFNWFT